MFELTKEEKDEVVANCDHLERLKFSRFLPNIFTEHGTMMAANVLNSPAAIESSVYLVRAFIKMREVVSTHKEMAVKINGFEQKVGKHDAEIGAIIGTIKQLMKPKPDSKRTIGFIEDKNNKKK